MTMTPSARRANGSRDGPGVARPACPPAAGAAGVSGEGLEQGHFYGRKGGHQGVWPQRQAPFEVQGPLQCT